MRSAKFRCKLLRLCRLHVTKLDCAMRSHAIVSSSVGPEYYVGILSFVDKTQLEPGCSVLLHNKVLARGQALLHS